MLAPAHATLKIGDLDGQVLVRYGPTTIMGYRKKENGRRAGIVGQISAQKRVTTTNNARSRRPTPGLLPYCAEVARCASTGGTNHPVRRRIQGPFPVLRKSPPRGRCTGNQPAGGAFVGSANQEE